MNIGEASKATGLSVKMIRYYESIGLIPPAPRTLFGYRVYGGRDISTLRFIRKARDLGFLVEHIQRLINLWQNDRRASADAKDIALEQVRELESKIAEMQTILGNVRRLAESCSGNEQPVCPIIDHMASSETNQMRTITAPRFDGVATLSSTMKRRGTSTTKFSDQGLRA